MPDDYNPTYSKVSPYSIKSYTIFLRQPSKSSANGCGRIKLVQYQPFWGVSDIACK